MRNLVSYLLTKKAEYPFSKARVYLNGVIAVLTAIFSLSLMISPLNILLLAGYISFTSIVTLLMYMIKLYTLLKMETSEFEETTPHPEDAQTSTNLRKWDIIFLIILVMTAISLPIILVPFLPPAWWFLGFAGFVTGASLSEVFLYLFAAKGMAPKKQNVLR